jgi:hypothetical protein
MLPRELFPARRYALTARITKPLLSAYQETFSGFSGSCSVAIFESVGILHFGLS